jgi:hypothetical protein
MEKYKGALNKSMTAQVGPKKTKVTYQFKALDGIPQAGDLSMKVFFTAAGKEYVYSGDGWDFKATREGKPINPESKISGLDMPIEMVASELVEHYLRSIAPKEAVDEWIDLGTYKIDKGDLVESQD